MLTFGVPALVYVLSAATSGACAWLLFRSWRASGITLLLWSWICFAGLFLNGCLVILDLLVVTDTSLLAARQAVVLAALAILIFGFIWDAG
jgi:hypothetical protein